MCARNAGSRGPEPLEQCAQEAEFEERSGDHLRATGGQLVARTHRTNARAHRRLRREQLVEVVAQTGLVVQLEHAVLELFGDLDAHLQHSTVTVSFK